MVVTLKSPAGPHLLCLGVLGGSIAVTYSPLCCPMPLWKLPHRVWVKGNAAALTHLQPAQGEASKPSSCLHGTAGVAVSPGRDVLELNSLQVCSSVKLPPCMMPKGKRWCPSRFWCSALFFQNWPPPWVKKEPRAHPLGDSSASPNHLSLPPTHTHTHTAFASSIWTSRHHEAKTNKNLCYVLTKFITIEFMSKINYSFVPIIY